jgi:large repetitive protein
VELRAGLGQRPGCHPPVHVGRDFTVTLTARDEFGLTGTATQTVTIVRPAGNLAPVPVINEPSCVLLVCNFSAVGTVDPNVGDTISYLGTSVTAVPRARDGHRRARTFPAPGTYIVSLTATDGWGDAATVTREVTVTDV